MDEEGMRAVVVVGRQERKHAKLLVSGCIKQLTSNFARLLSCLSTTTIPVHNLPSLYTILVLYNNVALYNI